MNGKLLKHPAVIAVIASAVAWLIIVIVVVTHSDVQPDESVGPVSPPTTSYTDCWPEAPR